MKPSFLTIKFITCIKKFKCAWVAELVDARDLTSLGPCGCTSSILVLGTIKIKWVTWYRLTGKPRIYSVDY